MHANALTLTTFYTAFAELNALGMAQCYADNACFDDPVFSLRGKTRVMGMWQMLTQTTREQGADVWRLGFNGIQADDTTGQAHWNAHYRFSATARMVHNRIDAQFTFDAHGLIATHRDHFNFWAWSCQALGTPGWLLGWSPLLRSKVRRQAAKNLAQFMANRNAI